MRYLILLLLAPLALLAEEVETRLPDPLALTPKWWKYFEGEDLVKKSDDSIKHLESIVNSLDKSSREHVESMVAKIKTQIGAISQNQTASSPAIDFQIPIQDRYHIDEYLNYRRGTRDLNLRLENTREIIREQEAQVEDTHKYLDALRSAYDAGEDMESLDRLKLGLELMSHRFALILVRRVISDKATEEKLITGKLEETRALLEKCRPKVDIGLISADQLSKELTQAKKEQERLLASRSKSEAEALLSGTNGGVSIEEVQMALTSLHVLNLSIRQDLVNRDVSLEKTASWSKALNMAHKANVRWASRETKTLTHELKAAERMSDTERGNLSAVLEVIASLDEKILATRDLVHFVEERIIADLSWLEIATQKFSVHLSKIFSHLHSYLTYPIIRIGESETPVTSWAIVRLLILVVLALYISRWIQQVLKRTALKRGGLQGSNFYAAGRLIHYTILFMTVLIGFTLSGVDFSSLLLIGGALGVGIGFGLQGIANNFVSGLTILFERNLKIDDYIELADGRWGQVMEINFQNSLIRTFDGSDIIVPNGELVTKQITNWTHRDPFRRFHIPFGVAYGTDPEKLRDAVFTGTQELRENVEDPNREPQLWLISFGDSSLNYELIVWVNMRRSLVKSSIRAAYMAAVERALVKGDITIPFPQRDIHIIENAGDLSSSLR